MKHDSFYIFKAKNNYELGFLMGGHFGNKTRLVLAEKRKRLNWDKYQALSSPYFAATEKYFPSYTEEIRGYAKGAEVDYLDLWLLTMEFDGFCDSPAEKCTTMATNNGKLIIHNEDWHPELENNIYLILKEIGGQKIFELYYENTLGGNAISLNSNGFISAVNSLKHSDGQIGVPRDIIARWFSETRNPVSDFQKLEAAPRSHGDSYTIVDKNGKIINIECTAAKSLMAEQNSPFIHTNHYLSDLKIYENNGNETWSRERYAMARNEVKPCMSIEEAILCSGNDSAGAAKSIFNERTLARFIVDFDNLLVKVWLRREQDKGWVDYSLKELFK